MASPLRRLARVGAETAVGLGLAAVWAYDVLDLGVGDPFVGRVFGLGILAVVSISAWLALRRRARSEERLAHATQVREEQLLQSQKMEALGQLAGGIAHDFNNLLTGIGGYADLAATTADAAVAARCLDGIKTAAGEASALTARLLAFSRRDIVERELVDLNDVAASSIELLGRLVRADVTIELERCTSLPPVAANAARLKQVILNLALNARDAMADGGTLTIATSLSGETVVLRVTDTGAGMDPAIRARALEPFFTTKPEGAGTGLGLSVVYGVVEALGGNVTIESEVGAGTTVEVSLPAAARDAEAAEERARAGDGGTERILVVDDRDLVRALVRDVLAAAGFAVEAVADGAAAIELAARRPPDLLVTDVVMPEMSGKELAGHLRATRPDLPVLFMSGYTDDVLDGAELAAPRTAFLRKPFANAALVHAARELLDQACAAAAFANARSSGSAGAA